MKFGIKIIFKNSDIYQVTAIKKIFDFIEELNCFLEPPLRKFKLIERNTGAKVTYSRSFQLRENNNHFLDTFRDRKYSSISFYNGNSDNPSISLHIDIDRDDILKNASSKLEFFAEDIEFSSNNLLDTFITKSLTIEDFIYGYIVVNDAKFKEFHSQLSWVAIEKWDSTNGFSETKFQSEVGFYQANINKLNKYVPKAYWGNFLNANHIQKLGGIEEVKKDAPVFLVKPLENGGAFLQLTQSVKDYNKNNYFNLMKRLDEYFASIILPDRPTISY